MGWRLSTAVPPDFTGESGGTGSVDFTPRTSADNGSPIELNNSKLVLIAPQAQGGSRMMVSNTLIVLGADRTSNYRL